MANLTRTTFQLSTEDLETAQPARPSFALRNDANIARADALLKLLGIRCQVDEVGAALVYSFADETAHRIARRNVARHIDATKEGRAWKAAA